jgi:hypothetical protein
MLVMNWHAADLDLRQTAMLTFAEKNRKTSAERLVTTPDTARRRV